NLSQAVDGVEEGLPGRDVVVPPASTLFHVAAIDIDLLENGGDPQFGAKVAGQRGELFEDTFHSGARIVVGELQTHGPAAQVLDQELPAIRILEVRRADDEG